MTTSRLLVEALSSPVDLAILFLAAIGAYWVVAKTVEAFHRPRGAPGSPAAAAPVPASTIILPPAVAPPPVVAEVPAELLAVLAAAVYSALGSGHEIVAIESGDQPSPTPQILAWSAEGRRAQYASHKIR